MSPNSPEPELWARARHDPDAMALADSAQEMSWRDVADRVARLANALAERVPGPTPRVAVLGDNAIDTVLFYAAAVIAGVGVIPLNIHLKPDEVAYILRDSGTRWLWTDDQHRDVAEGAARAADGIGVLHSRSTSAEDSEWDTAVVSASADPLTWDRSVGSNLVYTSGTTGYPKAVRRADSLEASVGHQVARFGAHYASGLGPHLVVGPLYHSGPHASIGLLLAGNSVVVPGRFEAERVLWAVAHFGVASTLLVPTHYVRLLALPDEVKAQYDLSSLRVVGQTGSSCPVDVKRAMIAWFGPIIRESYGSTESGILSVITSADWLEHPGSVGRAVPTVVPVVLDESGAELPAGTPGRLFFRDRSGKGIEYHNDPEKTASAHIAPGVFTIGEIGYVDADGYIYITDRFADMVVSGGVNVYPAECEQMLMRHEAVRDAAVFGVADPEMGERLVGLVVLATEVSPAELVAFCRERLAHYKVPSTLQVVADLPRNPMGKLDKRKLRDEYVSIAGI